MRGGAGSASPLLVAGCWLLVIGWRAGGASGLVLCWAVIFFAAIFTDSRGRADDPFTSEIAWRVEREGVTSQQLAEGQRKRNITTVGMGRAMAGDRQAFT